MALGCFPRLKIIHPSRKFMGHIYIPLVNWFLLVSCLVFIASIGDTNEIGNAYGKTNSLEMLILSSTTNKALSFLPFSTGMLVR